MLDMLAQEANARLPPDSSDGTGARRDPWIWLIMPAALFLASVAVTQAPFMGDSIYYVADIHAVRSGSAAHETLWEFGHILWRPLGYWFSSLFVGWIPNSGLSTTV